MKLRQSSVLGIAIALLGTVSTLGDVVSTSDGSRFVGTVEQMANGKVVILTEIAGRLEIDVSKVTAITADQPVNVQFESGDRLVGTIEPLPEEGGSIMHTALGDIAVPPGQVVAIWPAGAESPEVIALQKKVEETKTALTPKWTAKLEAGGTMTEGNTDTLQARGRFDLERKTPDDLLKFFLAAKYYEQDDRRTENEYKGGVRYEQSITERWYWYTRLGMEYDEFEDLDLRATATAGAGYYWLKKPDHELKSRVGLGYRHESYNTGVTKDEAVLDLGLDYRLDVAPWLQFTHEATYSPGFEDFDDYRLDFDTALLFPLKYEAWKFKVGMTNEYNSRPQRGLERLDNTYYASIVLELK